jgi:two-component system LytT family response regulator
VDDERLARAALKRLLLSESDAEIVGEAENIRETLKQIEEKSPNLIFMDIELRNSNGFDIFDKLENPPIIVFVTAYAEHAVKAFSVNATDYLLKPVSQPRLIETLERVRQKLTSFLKEDLSKIATIELKVPGRSIIISTNEIAALKADGDFTHVIFITQPELMICRTLLSLEKSLLEPNFLRIGRSTIININHVRGIIADKKSGALVKFDGVEEHLKIGPTSASRLRKALADKVNQQP